MKPKDEKDLKSLLYDLYAGALRVYRAHAIDEQGEHSDWQEWVDLRRTLLQAKYLLKRMAVVGDYPDDSFLSTPRMPRERP